MSTLWIYAFLYFVTRGSGMDLRLSKGTPLSSLRSKVQQPHFGVQRGVAAAAVQFAKAASAAYECVSNCSLAGVLHCEAWVVANGCLAAHGMLRSSVTTSSAQVLRTLLHMLHSMQQHQCQIFGKIQASSNSEAHSCKFRLHITFSALHLQCRPVDGRIIKKPFKPCTDTSALCTQGVLPSHHALAVHNAARCSAAACYNEAQQ
jgi:hypothetical protein